MIRAFFLPIVFLALPSLALPVLALTAAPAHGQTAPIKAAIVQGSAELQSAAKHS
jgi:hypothetical protein